jgi:choline dehydrogenase-like flavoprotein
MENYGVTILSKCTVKKIKTSKKVANGIECVWGDRRIELRAKLVILAAGAYQTPRLLLRSASEEFRDGLANSSGQVGRNLMLHVSDMFLLKARGANPPPTMDHGISFNDFYNADGEKLGNVHAHPFSVTQDLVMTFLDINARKNPAWWKSVARPLFPIAAKIGAAWYSPAVTIATVLEDLPYADNRVHPPQSDDDESVAYTYNYSEELTRRVASLHRHIRGRLGKRFSVSLLTKKDNLNLAHACGTCRMGEDPRTSVVDSKNRCHDLDNVYIADASFFPSSGGINPSLTIAANGLRLAGYLHQRLGTS